MRSNSITVRIWLPFVLSAVVLVLIVGVVLPRYQRATLEDFYVAELNLMAESLSEVVEFATANNNLGLIQVTRDRLENNQRVAFLSLSFRDLDNSDFLLMTPDASVDSMVSASILDARVKEFMQSSDPSLLEDLPLVGTAKYVEKLGGIEYITVVYGNQNYFETELLRLRYPITLMQIILFLGAAVLFYYLAFRISRPILHMAEVANEMREGNLEVDIRSEPSFDEMGALLNAFETLRDDLLVKQKENKELTEDMERKIVERTEQLQVALNAKDEFLSTMSHEIRTPLHSLIAIGDMLQKDVHNDQKEELLRSMNTSSKQLLALINDILDFSKISAGKLELHNEPVSLASFFEELAEPFRVAKHDKVEFIVNWPEKMEDRVVLTDPMRLSQILHNLLSNAFKFTEEGEVILAVKCRPAEVEGDPHLELEVQVVDTGLGIAEESLDAILKAFTQENSSISRRYGGTGLGLSIVNRLLQLMGSQLEVESTQGQGSMFGFCLTLPLASMPQLEDDAEERSSSSLEGLRVLYVEDMEPNRFVMKAMMRPWKVDLTLAANGHEALQLVNESEFDAVLMDIQMPEMDGVETLKQIRARKGSAWSTPVVAFTAHAQDSDVRRYIDDGFHGVLTKPIGPDALESFLLSFVG